MDALVAIRLPQRCILRGYELAGRIFDGSNQLHGGTMDWQGREAAIVEAARARRVAVVLHNRPFFKYKSALTQ